MRRVLLDGLWLVLVLLVTGAGMWLSSSLALYLNGPVWLAYALGVLAFPVLPLAWEARAAVRARAQAQPAPRLLHGVGPPGDADVAVNLLLVGILLARWPTAAFAAWPRAGLVPRGPIGRGSARGAGAAAAHRGRSRVAVSGHAPQPQ